ncbi:hypothetical protein [Bradyrhizobium elkanii]
MKITITGTPSNFAKSVKAPITCTKCKHKDEHRLIDLKNNPLVRCSKCDNKMQIQSDPSVQKALSELEALDKQFNNLLGRK